jgi:hypothetical protein
MKPIVKQRAVATSGVVVHSRDLSRTLLGALGLSPYPESLLSARRYDRSWPSPWLLDISLYSAYAAKQSDQRFALSAVQLNSKVCIKLFLGFLNASIAPELRMLRQESTTRVHRSSYLLVRMHILRILRHKYTFGEMP